MGLHKQHMKIMSQFRRSLHEAENGFEPKTINVKAGQIVTWKNMDNSLHTIISGTGLNDPNNGKAFDSGIDFAHSR